MKTPVIIAAYNEEVRIGRALDSLDPTIVEPIVAINGTTDATRFIAESYGATIVEREEQGNLPAIQLALQTLGERALDPVLYLDADSYPQFGSKHWSRSMLRTMGREATTAVVAGPIAYSEAPTQDLVLRNGMRIYRTLRARNSTTDEELFGTNMATWMKDTDKLDAILDLPHIWPGEDRAIGHTLVELGGTISYSMSPLACVSTSARYHPPLVARLLKGQNLSASARLQFMKGEYVDRTPPNAEERYEDGQFFPITKTD